MSCIAYIRREWDDGGETEFYYDNRTLAIDLLKCKTVVEVRELFNDPSIVRVETKKGVLPLVLPLK